MHVRTRIFEAIVALLAAIDGFSGGGKVRRGRTDPVPQELLPAITVTWANQDEQASLRPFAGLAGEPGYDRTLPIAIIVHYGASEPEADFDDLAVSIEGAMAGLVDLDGIGIEMTLQSSQVFIEPHTGLPLGAGRLVYTASYKTLAADPSVAAA